MPSIIEFPIELGDPSPAKSYRALYANLLHWVSAADSELATALHNRSLHKPFTLSALVQKRDGHWHWRVTLLQDELWEPLWLGVQTVGALSLSGHVASVQWSSAQIVRRSYDFLLTQASPVNRIEVRFISPTTFRAGNLDLPLPEPGAVFRSWLSRWNDFSPPQQRISTDLLHVVRTSVGISAHKLRTESHNLGSYRVVGFLGQVTFAITKYRQLGQAVIKQLNVLADYAEFCGTGRKTTYGMGQTRRICRE
jgi:CRISPR-associated endoribonuclease Cas6